MAEGQGRSSNQGVKLLYIRDYLHKYTNKEHPKSAKEICEYLASKGIKADRKTIYNDILRLQVDFQEPIEYNPKKWGYYITSPTFSTFELRAMIEGAQASTLLTQKEIDQITNKIADLANIYDRQSLKPDAEETPTGGYSVIGIAAKRAESVLRKVDLIQEALSKHKQISFRYFIYLMKDSNRTQNGKCYRKANKDGDLFIASPREIKYSGGTYTLKCYQSNEWLNLTRYSIDNMDDIKILSQDIIPVQAVDEYELPIQRGIKSNMTPAEQELERVRQQIEDYDMQKTNEYAVTLKFLSLYTEAFQAKFGRDAVIVPIERRLCRATVRVVLGQDFFSWLFSNKFYFQIIAPQKAIDDYRKYLEDILYFYEHGQEPRGEIDDLLAQLVACRKIVESERKR